MKKQIILMVIIWMGCSTSVKGPTLESIGALREIMHQGRYDARVNLDTLVEENMYGLGASDSLSGELLVINGRLFHSFVENDSLITSIDQSADATLLVYSRVTAWDTIDISRTWDVGEVLAEQTDLSREFPFMIIGNASIDYHVINFDRKNGDFSNHSEGAYHASLEKEAVLVLGFYSTKAHGMYTHHDNDLHMHVITMDHTKMGHVDNISLNGDPYKLLIPKR